MTVMGKSTSILPKGISRYRVFQMGEKFRFDRAYQSKQDAESGADRERRYGYRCRVVSISGKVHGLTYNWAVYVRRGRDRAPTGMVKKRKRKRGS